MKKISIFFWVVLVSLLYSCKRDTAVLFTYSPAHPRAGQRISFENLTKEGEEWSWLFGDGSESEVQSPSKIYKEPGEYTVTLKVDSKKSRTYSQRITVYDTVPALSCSSDVIPYFSVVTFKVLLYNPNNLAVTYRWHLPKEAVYQASDSTKSTLHVYFPPSVGDSVLVGMTITVGERQYLLAREYPLKDTPSTSLYFLTDDSRFFCQQMYDQGLVDSVLLPYPQKAVKLDLASDYLYIQNDDYSVYGYDLSAEKGFILPAAEEAPIAFAQDGAYYFAQDNALNRILIAAQEQTELAAFSSLVGFPDKVYAWNKHASVYFVAGEQGLYRFQEKDIDSGSPSSLQPILKQFAVRELAVDVISHKLYFLTEDNELYVSNINGSYPERIISSATSMFVHNPSSRLFYATPSGIYYIPLIQTQNNSFVLNPYTINKQANVSSLVVDTKKREGKAW